VHFTVQLKIYEADGQGESRQVGELVSLTVRADSKNEAINKAIKHLENEVERSGQ
jgi:hypothetical protein